MKDCKVNILGTEYSIFIVDMFPERLEDFEETADGLFNAANQEIYLKSGSDDTELTAEGKERNLKKICRHEIIHAFLFESGLSSDTYGHVGAWAEHEEMVDWFAIQSPKIYKIFAELEIL